MSIGSDKYVVVLVGGLQRLTRATTRNRAHAVASMLGDGYAVWNLYTRKIST